MSTNNPIPLPADLLRFVLQQTVYKRVGEHLQNAREDEGQKFLCHFHDFLPP